MHYNCAQCGKPFEASPAAKRKFCSRQCWRESLDKRIERICETCGKPFLAKRDKVASGQGRFCSRECANTGWDEPCENCGKPVHRTPYHATTQKHAFCSRTCYGLWKRRRVVRTCAHCGIEYITKPSKNITYCSQACYDDARAQEVTMLVCEQCGCSFEIPQSSLNPHMYQGRFCSNQCRAAARRMPDSVRSVYSHEFTEALKQEIRQRDNHTCQLCGIHDSDTSRALDVHHIDYDKANNDPANLVTLCASCHSQTNYNRPYWQRRLDTR